ncbi:hypothetical protein BD414DRAFT_175369 [Trametes punicea]|nr:hypothetical protein BD414DRAFT_175369 [Trametes punicea]
MPSQNDGTGRKLFHIQYRGPPLSAAISRQATQSLPIPVGAVDDRACDRIALLYDPSSTLFAKVLQRMLSHAGRVRRAWVLRVPSVQRAALKEQPEHVATRALHNRPYTGGQHGAISMAVERNHLSRVPDRKNVIEGPAVDNCLGRHRPSASVEQAANGYNRARSARRLSAPCAHRC